MTVPNRTLSSTAQEHLDDHNGRIRTAANRVFDLSDRSSYVDVRDFGAVGDWQQSTGVGTDNRAAIQAALDSTKAGQPNAGKVTLLTPSASGSRYRINGALNLSTGTHLSGGPYELRPQALNNQGPVHSVSLEFYGGATENAIQAIGTTQLSISQAAVSGFFLADRRTTPTSGNGIHFQKLVNQTVVRHMSIHGFSTGASIRATASSGQTSDCIEIDDVWSIGAQYGVYCNNIDNYLMIRGLKVDTTSATVAAVRIESCNAGVLIDGIKQESTSTTVRSVIVGPNVRALDVRGIALRSSGLGAAIVTFDGTEAIAANLRGLWRETSGVLVEQINAAPNWTFSGTRCTSWVSKGINDGLRIGNAQLYVDYSTGALMYRGTAGTTTQVAPA